MTKKFDWFLEGIEPKQQARSVEELDATYGKETPGSLYGCEPGCNCDGQHSEEEPRPGTETWLKNWMKAAGEPKQLVSEEIDLEAMYGPFEPRPESQKRARRRRAVSARDEARARLKRSELTPEPPRKTILERAAEHHGF